MYRNPIANVNCTDTKTCALNLVQTETVSLTRLLGKRKSTKNETVSLYNVHVYGQGIVESVLTDALIQSEHVVK
jgi:hypothetical protein